MKLSAGLGFSLTNLSLGVLVSYNIGMVGSQRIQQAVLDLQLPLQSQQARPTAVVRQDQQRPYEEFTTTLDSNVFHAQKKEQPKPPPQPAPVQPEQASGEPQPVVEVAPPTQLDLAVSGTMIYGPKSSFAFISRKGKLEQYSVYQVGECIDPENYRPDEDCKAGSIRVVEIRDREVLIEHEGHKERVLMENDPMYAAISEEISPRPTQKALIQTTGSSKSQTSSARRTTEQKGSVTEPALPQEGQTTFNYTRAWVDEQLENFEKILMDARVVATESKPPRFKFKFIKHGSLYEKLGLQKDDVILEVNGFVIDSISKALKLLETLQSEREIVLKIERQKQPVTFRYFID